MRDSRLRPLPATLLALTLAVELTAVALSWGLESRYDTILYAVYAATLAGAGALVASRQPRNPIGWLFLVFALAGAVMADAAQGWALQATERGWRGGDTAELLASAGRQPSGLCWILTFLLIPDGRLPSRRWRLAVWVAAVGTVLTMVGWSLDEDLYDFPSGHNPFAVEGLPTGALFGAGVTPDDRRAACGGGVAGSPFPPRTRRRAPAAEMVRAGRRHRGGRAAGVVCALVRDLARPGADRGRADSASDRRVRRDPPLPPVRDRPRHQPHPGLRRGHRHPGRGVRRDDGAARDGARPRLRLGDGRRDARRRGRLPAAAYTGAGLGRSSLQPRALRRGAPDDARFSRLSATAAPRRRRWRESCASCMADPRLELLFFLPESELYVDARGVPARGLADDTRQQIPIERGGQPLGMVLLDPPTAGAARPAAQARRGRRAGDRDRPTARRAAPPARRGRGLAGADRRGRQRRAPPDRARSPRRRPAAARLDRARAAPRPARARVGVAGARRPDPRRRGRRGRRRDRRAARARARAAARRSSTPGWRRPSTSSPAERRYRSRWTRRASVSAATSRRRPTSSAARASPTPSSTPTPPRSSSARGGENGSSSSPSPTTASAAPIVGQGSGLRGLSDRVAALGGTLRIESAPGAGTTLTAELPCAS